MSEPVAAHNGLPGADLVERGLADLARGAVSDEALLVAIGAPRLRRLGLVVPAWSGPSPELALYERLAARTGNDAHSRYNALLRRLVSFERGLELRVRCAADGAQARAVEGADPPRGRA